MHIHPYSMGISNHNHSHDDPYFQKLGTIKYIEVFLKNTHTTSLLSSATGDATRKKK